MVRLCATAGKAKVEKLPADSRGDFDQTGLPASQTSR
jgi:hypothetical protein